MGLTNAWLQTQGLVSFKQQWVKSGIQTASETPCAVPHAGCRGEGLARDQSLPNYDFSLLER